MSALDHLLTLMYFADGGSCAGHGINPYLISGFALVDNSSGHLDERELAMGDD